MGKLNDQVALVTGAASGIGDAISRLFIAEGARVLLCDINEAGSQLAKQLGENAEFCSLDVSSEDAWSRAVSVAEQLFDDVNVLINCAGLALLAPIEETTLNLIERQYRVNQLGTLLGARAVVPSMTHAGGGSIVNISSGVALKAVPGMTAYVATKWAVRGITKCLAGELADRKIRVNAIFPGMTDTPQLQGNLVHFDSDTLIQGIPMHRFGTADEVARAALFLAAPDDANYITGADIAVDGGYAAI